MASVTQRISKVSQPRGGYLNPKSFSVTQLNDNLKLYEHENLHASLVGLAVDYLARYINGAELHDAFKISLMGSMIIGESMEAEYLLSNVCDLNSDSIKAACKLAGYDVCYRAGIMGYRPVEDIDADKDTIENIRIMVERSLGFFKDFGPVVHDGFTFEGGYSAAVTAGDGDFLTEDTLWDFKTLKNDITNKHTLQLLMYYIMGMHSTWTYFDSVTFLGVFNPRLHKVYRLSISDIDKGIIEAVEKEVICY